MNVNGGFPILTFVQRTFSLFFILASLIGLFVGLEFLKTTSDVSAEVNPIHKIDINAVRQAYEGEVPTSIEDGVTAYNQQGEEMEPSEWFGFLPAFVRCPESPELWAFSLEREEPEWFEEEKLPEWLEQGWPEIRGLFGGHRYESFEELLEARRQLMSMVRTEFQFGGPRAACAIILTLARSGNLKEEELSAAARALRKAEYIVVDVLVANDGSVPAQQVKVRTHEPDVFECQPKDAGKAGECEPFDLGVNKRETVRFTGQAGRLLDKSDRDLETMFQAIPQESEVPDTPRILGWVTWAAVFTCIIAGVQLLSIALKRSSGPNGRRIRWLLAVLLSIFVVLAIIYRPVRR